MPSATWPTIYELQGDRARALAARLVAADAFAANGLPGEAAAERLVGGGYLQSAGRQEEALELMRLAGEEAARAERTDLRARTLGLGGVAMAKGGDFEAGMEKIREGLSLALDHGLPLSPPRSTSASAPPMSLRATTPPRAMRCQPRSASANRGRHAMEYTCLSCLAYVLRELGDWDRSRSCATTSCHRATHRRDAGR